MKRVVEVTFTDYRRSVAEALDAVGAAERLPQEGLILIKPNLTNDSPPPVTTPVAAAEAVYLYCRERTAAEIAIAEGCGSGRTADVFGRLGYDDLARRYGLRLIDFNEAPALKHHLAEADPWPDLYLPAVVREAFLISLPVLKDHSMTTTTIAMKNLFGLAPALYYRGSWNKSRLHSPSTHRSVVAVCRHRPPDLCVVDALVALTGSHLSGREKRIGRILAGFDPVAVDAVGSDLLGHDADRIEYITLAEGVLGSAKDIRTP